MVAAAAMSVMDPHELAAAPRATSRVLVSSRFSRWSRSRRQQPGLKFTLNERKLTSITYGSVDKFVQAPVLLTRCIVWIYVVLRNNKYQTPAHCNALLLSHESPGGDVGIMVEVGHHNTVRRVGMRRHLLVSLLQGPAYCSVRKVWLQYIWCLNTWRHGGSVLSCWPQKWPKTRLNNTVHEGPPLRGKSWGMRPPYLLLLPFLQTQM